MIKKHTLLFFLFLSNILLFGQNFKDIESEIQNFSAYHKVHVLNDYVWKLRNNKPDLALICGKKAIKISKKLNDLGLLASSFNLTGVIYRNLSRFGKAMSFYKEALKFANLAKDSLQIAYSLNNIGGIYRMQTQFSLALENIFGALAIFNKLQDLSGQAFCSINIGIIYRELREFELSKEFLNKTIELRKKTGDEFGLSLAYHHLGELYYVTKKYDKAMNIYKMLEQDYKNHNDLKGLGYIYGGMAEINIISDNYEEALNLRKKSLETFRKINNMEGEVIGLLGMAVAEAKLKRFKEGQYHINIAYKYLTEDSLSNKLPDYYNALYILNFESGNYKEALNNKNSYINIKEEISERENSIRLAALAKMYESQEIFNKNELLEKDLLIYENEKNYTILLSIVAFTFVVILLVRNRRVNYLNRELKKNNKAKDQLFGIIAHDLKNPFFSLLGNTELLNDSFDQMDDEDKKSIILSIRDNTKNIYQLVINLLDWFRMQFKQIEVNKELINISEQVEKLINLFKPIADIKNINLNNEIDDSLTCYCDPNILDTILRNLLNNSIKFTNNGGQIKFRCNRKETETIFEVEDNGIGMDKETLQKLFDVENHSTRSGTANEKGSGLGLHLVKELVDHLNGTIKVSSEENVGTTFTIVIPDNI